MGGDTRDDSVEILFQSFLQGAVVSSSGIGRDVQSDVVRPSFPLPTTTALAFQGAIKGGFWWGILRRAACPNRGTLRLLTVARRGSFEPTRKLVLLNTQSLVMCSK